jgi:hypothetical protein
MTKIDTDWFPNAANLENPVRVTPQSALINGVSFILHICKALSFLLPSRRIYLISCA